MECLHSGVVTCVFKEHLDPLPTTTDCKGTVDGGQETQLGRVMLIAVTTNPRYTRITEQEWKQLGERAVNVRG